MTLDVSQIAEQLDAVREDLRQRSAERWRATCRAVELLAREPTALINDRIAQAGQKLVWPVPSPVVRLAERTTVPAPPADFAVVAADGSMIEIDRHRALGCYVINVGWAVIGYGREPFCELKAEASLETRRLSYVDPDDHTVRRIDGQLLGIQRSIEEYERVASLVEALPPDLPALAMVDNPLTVWGLADPRVKGFIRAVPPGGGSSLLERYTAALERVERACHNRPAALVGYVSAPSLEFVANLLRVAECPHPVCDCRRNCPSSDPDQRDCRGVATSDAALFKSFLRKGERSALFHGRRAGADDAGPDIWFCYFHTGEEIARIEMPAWVACDPQRVNLALALVFDQVERGQGYPAALIEAHECAVISQADRQMFDRLVLESVVDAGLPEHGSAKARSKRIRGV